MEKRIICGWACRRMLGIGVSDVNGRKKRAKDRHVKEGQVGGEM